MADPQDVPVRSTADVTDRIVVKGIVDPEKLPRVVVKGASSDRARFVVSGAEDAKRMLVSGAASVTNAAERARRDYGLDVASAYAKAARLNIPQTTTERALQYVAAINAARFPDVLTTSERVLQTMGTSSIVDSVQRIAESMNHAGMTSALAAITKADLTNKTVLGMMSTEAKLGEYVTEHYKTVAGHAAEMASVSGLAVTRMYEALPIVSTAAFMADQVTRLRELQTFPEQILAQFSPDSSRLLADVLAAQERMLESRYLREWRQEEDEWRSFLRSLAIEHGFDAKKLLARLPSPLGPLGSLARLHRAEQAVEAIDQLQDAWRGDDEKRAKTLQKWRKDALAELRAARRQAKAARFLPGSKGLRLAVPKGDESWADMLKRDPRWRNPTSWPWLLDRAFAVATFLANYVTSDRSRRRLGDKGRRRRRMANKVLDLTAEILNRWYRRSLFHDLDISPKQVKAAVSNRLQQERKSAKSRKSQ